MNFVVKPLRYGAKENSSAGIGSLGLSAVIAFLLSAETTTSTSGSPWFSLIFFGAIFAAMYFLLLRPQRRRVKESQNLQSSIAVNDEVILSWFKICTGSLARDWGTRIVSARSHDNFMRGMCKLRRHMSIARKSASSGFLILFIGIRWSVAAPEV